MNERDWKLLITLHEQRSITQASRVLHLTQPALSTRLRGIEDFFGVEAVIRGKKGVQFTAEGECLVRKARAVLADLDKTRDELDSMKHNAAGTLRIGASHLFTRYILPDILQQFKSLHPAAEYRLQTGWTNEMIRQVLQNETHLAFIREDCAWTGIKRLLFSEYMLLACADDFLLGDLPHMPLIQYTNEPANQLLIDTWWAENLSVPPQVGMVVDRADTCLAMVSRGLGYGFLSSGLLREAPGLHTKEIRYRSGRLLERSTWLILKEETATLRLVREFLNMLDEVNFLRVRHG